MAVEVAVELMVESVAVSATAQGRAWRWHRFIPLLSALMIALAVGTAACGDEGHSSDAGLSSEVVGVGETSESAEEDTGDDPARVIPGQVSGLEPAPPVMGLAPFTSVSAADYVDSPFGLAYPTWASAFLKLEWPSKVMAGEYLRLKFADPAGQAEVDVAIRRKADLPDLADTVIDDLEIYFDGLNLRDGGNPSLHREDLQVAQGKRADTGDLVATDLRLPALYALAAEGERGRVHAWFVDNAAFSITVTLYETVGADGSYNSNSNMPRLIEELVVFEVPVAVAEITEVDGRTDWWDPTTFEELRLRLADAVSDVAVPSELAQLKSAEGRDVHGFVADDGARITISDWAPLNPPMPVSQTVAADVVAALGAEFGGEVPPIEHRKFDVHALRTDVDGAIVEVGNQFPGEQLALSDGSGGRITFFWVVVENVPIGMELRQPAAALANGTFETEFRSIVPLQFPG